MSVIILQQATRHLHFSESILRRTACFRCMRMKVTHLGWTILLALISSQLWIGKEDPFVKCIVLEQASIGTELIRHKRFEMKPVYNIKPTITNKWRQIHIVLQSYYWSVFIFAAKFVKHVRRSCQFIEMQKAILIVTTAQRVCVGLIRCLLDIYKLASITLHRFNKLWQTISSCIGSHVKKSSTLGF